VTPRLHTWLAPSQALALVVNPRLGLGQKFPMLHFGHRWLTHFGCASGSLGFYHSFFG